MAVASAGEGARLLLEQRAAGITTAFNMFEMWSAVSSKLEHSASSSAGGGGGSPLPLTAHAPQTPHTSSGSIKGNFNMLIPSVSMTRDVVETGTIRL